MGSRWHKRGIWPSSLGRFFHAFVRSDKHDHTYLDRKRRRAKECVSLALPVSGAAASRCYADDEPTDQTAGVCLQDEYFGRATLTCKPATDAEHSSDQGYRCGR